MLNQDVVGEVEGEEANWADKRGCIVRSASICTECIHLFRRNTQSLRLVEQVTSLNVTRLSVCLPDLDRCYDSEAMTGKGVQIGDLPAKIV